MHWAEIRSSETDRRTELVRRRYVALNKSLESGESMFAAAYSSVVSRGFRTLVWAEWQPVLVQVFKR
jgi:hypothetical protein